MSAAAELDSAGKWPWAPLVEITRVVNGTTPKSTVAEYWGGDITWVTPTDLGKLEAKEVQKSERRITAAGLNSCGLTLVPPGSVILSSRAPIGHLAIAETELCFNQGCKAFIPGSQVDSEYLYYALLAHKSDIQKLGSGATFSEVSKSQVESFEIPLPPLEEQKRIAARLTCQLAAVERARRASEARLEAARALPAAWLRDLFGTEMKTGWPLAPVGELMATEIRTGISKPENPDSNVRCLTLSAVRNGELKAKASKPVLVTPAQAEANTVRQGAFYVMRGNGNRLLVGRGGIAHATHENLLFPDLLFELNPDVDQLSVEYLRWVWDSEILRIQIEEKARTAAGIYKINKRNLESIVIPLPSLQEQYQIVETLRNKFSMFQHLEQDIISEHSTLAAMPSSLLRQAFADAQ